MFHLSLRPASRAALAGASLLTLALSLGAFPHGAAAWPVGQDDEVALDDFTATSKDGAVHKALCCDTCAKNYKEGSVRLAKEQVPA